MKMPETCSNRAEATIRRQYRRTLTTPAGSVSAACAGQKQQADRSRTSNRPADRHPAPGGDLYTIRRLKSLPVDHDRRRVRRAGTLATALSLLFSKRDGTVVNHPPGHSMQNPAACRCACPCRAWSPRIGIARPDSPARKGWHPHLVKHPRSMLCHRRQADLENPSNFLVSPPLDQQ